WGEFAALEIAAALRLTRAGAETELGIAAQLHALPALGAQLSEGAIDWRRARTTVDGVAHLDIDAAQRVIDEITEHLPDLTSGQIRALIRRVCLTHDPADANERMCHRIAERTVQAYPSPEGTAHLSISDVPAERAAAAMAHINHLARGLTGDGRTIDQRR